MVVISVRLTNKMPLVSGDNLRIDAPALEPSLLIQARERLGGIFGLFMNSSIVNMHYKYVRDQMYS